MKSQPYHLVKFHGFRIVWVEKVAYSVEHRVVQEAVLHSTLHIRNHVVHQNRPNDWQQRSRADQDELEDDRQRDVVYDRNKQD